MASKQVHTRKLTRSDRNLVELARMIHMEAQEIRTQSSVFDLDSKDYVTLVKVGTFTPVENTKDALERLGNDANKFLAIVNSGLKSYAIDELRDSDTPWSQEDEEGGLQPFSGSTISEEKAKNLNAIVLNMAKMNGYAKNLAPEKKREIKAAALSMVLSNDQFVAMLKS